MKRTRMSKEKENNDELKVISLRSESLSMGFVSTLHATLTLLLPHAQ